MENDIAVITKALKEFFFLKFDLKGDELVKEVESDKWKSAIENQQPTQIVSGLTLLQTQTKALYDKLHPPKQQEEKKVEEVSAKPQESISEEQKIEDAPQKKKGNESSTEVLQPHNNPPPRISTSAPISFISDSPPTPEIVTVQWALSESDWFSNLKAAAIFPHECDPVNYRNLTMIFQFKHIHIQLAHAARLGNWNAYDHIQRLGRYYAILPDHPVRQNYQKEDPLLKAGGSYVNFIVYTGHNKQDLTVFDSSKDRIEDFMDIETLTDKEKSQHLTELWEIERRET